ncbi:MAG: TonB-dependent receptor [Nitrosomonadales bacterium]|nr:TonB-dependent receptor [Nitrosomonadales bacterium]
MSMAILRSVCAMLAAVWTVGVFAETLSEEEELALVYGDKATVSIATGSRQDLRRAPSVASVVTAEDIAAMGAADLDEVLETVPGLHVSHSSIRYASTYMIRGLGVGNQANPQILLLQNGIPMTTMYNGDRGSAWNVVPLENVARIEIIRGPGSALYGADAFAGVINIITKTAEDTPGTEFGMRVGSFNTRGVWTQHGGNAGEAEVAAYLRVGSSDGIKEVTRAKSSPAPGSVSTDYDAVDGGLNLAYDKWRFRAGYKLRDNVGTGAGVSSALDPASKSRAEHLTSDISWTDPQFAQDWSVGVTAGYLYYSMEYRDNVMLLPPSARPPDGLIGGPNQWERQQRLSAFAAYSGLADHSMRLGLGHDDLDLYRTKTIKNYLFDASGVPVVTGPPTDYSDIQPHIRPQQRQVSYAYVQDEWRFSPDWTFTAGVRHDQYSDFGGTTNPRAALVWEAAYNLSAKLLYGRAFRAPSFNELYGINPVANGNPNLGPETIGTSEAAVSWQVNQDLQMNLGVFRYDAKDIIRLVGGYFTNIGGVHGSGAELESVWDIDRGVRLTGNYSFQESVDEETQADAGYAPHHHLFLRGDARLSLSLMASMKINWIADRKRAVGDARPEVADFKTVDLCLRTGQTDIPWDFAVSIRNLFNARVLEPTLAPGTALPDDLPMARRSFHIQAILYL